MFWAVLQQSVAERFLSDLPELEITPEIERGLISTFQYMHQSVVKASDRFLQVEQQYVSLYSTYFRNIL